EFPARCWSNRNTRGTSDGSSAPYPERSAGSRRPRSSQTTRLLRALVRGAAHESRPAPRQAQRATTRCFRGNRQSNPRAREVVCGIPLAACHRLIADLSLFLISLTPWL